MPLLFLCQGATWASPIRPIYRAPRMCTTRHNSPLTSTSGGCYHRLRNACESSRMWINRCCFRQEFDLWTINLPGVCGI